MAVERIRYYANGRWYTGGLKKSPSPEMVGRKPLPTEVPTDEDWDPPPETEEPKAKGRIPAHRGLHLTRIRSTAQRDYDGEDEDDNE